MRTLKITMLFLGMSVTSFAQIFEGFDVTHYGDEDVVYTIKSKTRAEAIHRTFKMLDDNNLDTTDKEIVMKSDVMIFMHWLDKNDSKKVYVLFCNKTESGEYRIAIIHQENKYTEYFYLNNQMLIYEPE
jgi:hypothetical protein